MAEGKCQVGARKENCQNKGASEEKGAAVTWKVKRICAPLPQNIPVPPPYILICTVAYLMLLSLLYPLALTAQVIELPATLLPSSCPPPSLLHHH